MNVSSKRLEGASVVTKSGQRLGKLVSLELDADTGKLTAVTVRPQGVAAALLENDLVIPWAQIVSLSEKRIVVADATVTNAEAALVPAANV